jgi:hypothetical protein
LRGGDPVPKVKAATNLAEIGPQAKGAILALLECFTDHRIVQVSNAMEAIDGEQTRWITAIVHTRPALQARTALVEIGEPAIEPLVAALQDRNKEVRALATSALREILEETKDARAVEPLIATLNHKNDDVRRRAALLLGIIGDTRAVEPLTAALKDKDEEVRERAAEALRNIR